MLLGAMGISVFATRGMLLHRYMGCYMTYQALARYSLGSGSMSGSISKKVWRPKKTVPQPGGTFRSHCHERCRIQTQMELHNTNYFVIHVRQKPKCVITKAFYPKDWGLNCDKNRSYCRNHVFSTAKKNNTGQSTKWWLWTSSLDLLQSHCMACLSW